MIEFERVMACDMNNKHEFLGMLEISILSCIAALAKEGMDKEAIEGIHSKIKEINATIWGVISLMFQSDGHRKVNETIISMVEQLQNQFSETLKLIDELKDVVISKQKNKSN